MYTAFKTESHAIEVAKGELDSMDAACKRCAAQAVNLAGVEINCIRCSQVIMAAGSVTFDVGMRAFFSAQGPGLSSKCSKEVLDRPTCVSCVKVLSPIRLYARMHEL